MSFPRYPKYKDSGVEWLGEVPEHWDVKPVKSLASIVNGYPFDSTLFDAAEGYPLIRIRDINKFEAETYYKGEFVETAAITSDDVLIGMDGDFNVGRWRGQGRALLNQRMCCVRGRSGLLTRLLEYSLPIRLKAINDITYATTVKHLASSQVEKTFVAIPPDSAEQTQIAAFLDRETAKIDELVAEQRRLMELLKEKRQAVISHAVTQGLNPDAPMKPSGIEWLGDVPAHWGISPLKYVATYNNEVLDEITAADTEIVYVDISSVDGVYGIKTKETILFSDAPSRARRRVRHGDVIVSTVRTYLKAIARIRAPEENLIVSTGFAVIRPRDELTPDFLGHLLFASYFIEQVIARSTGVSYPAINASELVAIPVTVPPPDEQAKIAVFLDTELAKLDTLTAEAQRAIDLLQERRTALISAAVTGQIDVRPH